MPRNDPPVHSRFKPGQSGNPTGKPKDSPELRKLKNLTKQELVDVATMVVKGNLPDLKDIARDPTAPVVRVMLAAVCIKIIQKGDMSALNILLDRLVGKVKDELYLTTDNPPQIIVTLPSNGREAKGEIADIGPRTIGIEVINSDDDEVDLGF